MKLIAGLGNPGGQYATTRHNVGFMVADRLADQAGVVGWNKKFKGFASTGDLKGQRIVLLKPQTYMNLSGESVQGAAAFYRIPPVDMVVVHDDIDFELGRVAVKVGGGHGGHNGLRSIMQHLGPDFVRVRMGVGRPAFDAANHVLSGFFDDERDDVETMLKLAVEAIEIILDEGPKKAQNMINGRDRAARKAAKKAAREAAEKAAREAEEEAGEG